MHDYQAGVGYRQTGPKTLRGMSNPSRSPKNLVRSLRYAATTCAAGVRAVFVQYSDFRSRR
ncbi:hypothetical protein BZL30_2834 [Mycobacterium kansasii]|uniref:Uncharacterized protein n=1 Tax=Mycobacterium kansasii TaxID=1768 RepID=A0A1V3XGH9_MYCKA|nr:hypothetical protein BZL30_2834 [Mycobacterium kansasii]OOK80572.1 hypothetical protein BZL29_2774 [Mycobacterium kansasii]